MAQMQVPSSDHWMLDSTSASARYRISLTLPMSPVKGPIPLLVVLDGDTMLLTATEAARTISISTMGALGPVAMVGIMRDCPDWGEYFSTRFRDFTPVEWRMTGPFEGDNAMIRHGSGGADLLVSAIVDEVIPQVRERVAIDDTRIGVCGWSLSGLFAAHAWVSRPDVFSDLVAISPSLWWNDASMVAAPLAPRPSGHRAVITAGEHEEGDLNRVWPAIFADAAQREKAAMVRNAVRFGEMTADAGADTLCVVIPGEHHVSLAPPSLSRALIHLYG